MSNGNQNWFYAESTCIAHSVVMSKQVTRGLTHRTTKSDIAARIVQVSENNFEIAEEPELIADQKLQTGNSRRSSTFVRLAQLRKRRECEQVAAVCYRVRKNEIEFLLVRTGGGRWTFPKGSAEPGLTHAQAAALEAFEEAGVHGRMEEASFTSYMYSKRERNSSAAKFAVSAHLCEVSRLEAPEESNRNPTWFASAEAKKLFREERINGEEMVRVVNRAVRRIRSRVQIPQKENHLRRAQVIEIDSLQRTANRQLL